VQAFFVSEDRVKSIFTDGKGLPVNQVIAKNGTDNLVLRCRVAVTFLFYQKLVVHIRSLTSNMRVLTLYLLG